MSGEDCSIRACRAGLVNFGILFGLYGLTLWLPQIVQAMGFSNLATSLIVALPFVASLPAMSSGDFERQKRRTHLACGAAIVARGCPHSLSPAPHHRMPFFIGCV